VYDADALREQLDTETVKMLLYTLGAEDIIDESNSKGQLITNTICHNHSGGSQKLYYLDDRKYFHCFTGCDSISIYDIVIERHRMKGISLTFQEAVEWVAVEAGFAFNFSHSPIIQPKNEELEWLKKFQRKKIEIPELTYYSPYTLWAFSYHGGHPSFTKDNISIEAMDRFQIRYDWGSNAIVIPHKYYKNGQIIGLMSRNLDKYAVENGFKYVPTKLQDTQFNFPKHLNLYGLWENRHTIRSLRKVAIFESEKSVLQCETYFGAENNFAIALGGKNLSKEHVNILIQMGVEQVILNFDKDYEDINSPAGKSMLEHIVKTARKLTPYMRVFATIDKKGLLELNDSPSDKGVKVLMQLLNDKEEIFNVK